MKVDFFKHNIAEEEKQAVISALDSKFLTTGDIVYTFEKKLSEFLGLNYSLGLTSCTAALHLSLLACGVGSGDEVITTPMTFAATSLAIIHCGATPVWVDVEESTGNIDVTKIESKITDKTKAILPVHLYGQMCNMPIIRNIADKYNLFVIEDAAHSLLADRFGVRVGELADTACFSFYATKSITCGEGGAVATNDKVLYNKIKMLRTHGMSGDAATRYTGTYKHWNLIDCGWKYNMDNIKASMLIPQLEKAEGFRNKRKGLYNWYRLGLSENTKIKLPFVDEMPGNSDYHLFTVWVDPLYRDLLLGALQESGIGVAVNYISINLLTAFVKKFGLIEGSFPISENIGASTISLPLYSKLSLEEVTYVCDVLNALMDQL